MKVLDKDRDVIRQNVHLERHYVGACHGKNTSDSEGGVRPRPTQGGVRHQHVCRGESKARETWCDKLGKDLNFMLKEPTHEERVTFESDPVRVRGTGQPQMTKVRVTDGGECDFE